MREYLQINDNVFYFPALTNIGLIKEDDGVILIDSGNDKDAGRKIRQVLECEGLNVKCILNTHSNADHIGANAYLMNYYGCSAYSLDREVAFSKYPDLESSLLYGGFPSKKMKNKFLMSKPCNMSNIEEFKHEKISYFKLEGHFLDMIGYKIDNIYFLGDCLFSQDTINKYHLFYIYDVAKFLKTLSFLEEINKEEAYYLLSHAPLTRDLSSLIDLNRKKVLEVIDLIKNYLDKNRGFEDIFKYLLDHYELMLDLNQYLLVGSTIRNYLSYLVDSNEIEMVFIDNRLVYKKL